MIIVTDRIKLELVEELENVKQTLINRAQRSRDAAGCIAYFSNIEDLTEIHLAEKWKSAELPQTHLDS